MKSQRQSLNRVKFEVVAFSDHFVMRINESVSIKLLITKVRELNRRYKVGLFDFLLQTVITDQKLLIWLKTTFGTKIFKRGDPAKKEKTSHCNNRALFPRKAPTKKEGPSTDPQCPLHPDAGVTEMQDFQ